MQNEGIAELKLATTTPTTPSNSSSSSSSRHYQPAVAPRQQRVGLLVLRGEEDENSAIWGLTDLGNANFGQFGRCVRV